MPSRVDSSAPPEANPPVRRGPPTRSPVVAGARMAWRWLTRMRTALYLLGVLGLLSLVATVVPQAPNVPATVSAWREGTDGPGTVTVALIDALGGFDVYGSAPFLAFLVLLFVSLTACLIPRYRAWIRVAFRSRPPRTANLDGHDHSVQFLSQRSPEETLVAARGVLAGKRFRLRAPAADPDEVAPQVAAERGHATREGGSLMFHTAFYVLLIGVVSGQLLGFSGQVGVVEGAGFADTSVAYWNQSPGRWWSDADHRGFVVTLDEFRVDWHRDPQFAGTPRLFESTVTIERPDGSTLTDVVGGNAPLVIDGMKIHQLDWGYAPRVVVEVDGVIVHDAFLTLTLTDLGIYRGAVKAPAADPDVGLEILLYPFAPAGPDGTPVTTGAPWADAPLLRALEYRGDLRLDSVQNVNRLDLTDLELRDGLQLRPGGEVTLQDGVTVSFPELRRWVGFQVSNRPTVPLLLLGGLLVLVGLLPALYAYRRRVWVMAHPAAVDAPDVPAPTLVTVAGRAFQRPQAFVDEFADIVDDLRAATAEPGRPTPRPEVAEEVTQP